MVSRVLRNVATFVVIIGFWILVIWTLGPVFWNIATSDDPDYANKICTPAIKDC
jgi:hypothetical protein